MSNIIDLIHQREKEVSMAKARLAQPTGEVAQIVFYYHGLQNAFKVSYVDMAEAKKQFKALNTLVESGKDGSIVLSGCASTAVIHNAVNIAMCFLVDVETDRMLFVDNQRRVNALMQLP